MAPIFQIFQAVQLPYTTEDLNKHNFVKAPSIIRWTTNLLSAIASLLIYKYTLIQHIARKDQRSKLLAFIVECLMSSTCLSCSFGQQNLCFTAKSLNTDHCSMTKLLVLKAVIKTAS